MIIFRLENTAGKKIYSDYLQEDLENDNQIFYKSGLVSLSFDPTCYWLMLNKKVQGKKHSFLIYAFPQLNITQEVIFCK